jgi:hypothetical protein
MISMRPLIPKSRLECANLPMCFPCRFPAAIEEQPPIRDSTRGRRVTTVRKTMSGDQPTTAWKAAPDRNARTATVRRRPLFRTVASEPIGRPTASAKRRMATAAPPKTGLRKHQYLPVLESRPRRELCVKIFLNLGPLAGWVQNYLPNFHGTPASIKCGAVLLEKRGSESEKSKINLGDTPLLPRNFAKRRPARCGLFSWSSNDSICHLERMRLVQMPQTV